MALATGSYVFGQHAFFFRDGDAYTVPGAGTASRTAKPGETDPAWMNLGIVEEASDGLEDTEIEIFAPTPGRLRLYDVINTKDKLNLKFTTSELSAVAVETLYRTLSLSPSSTQFNPLEGKTKKGWLKIQRYDQGDAQRIVMDLFCRLKVTGDTPMHGDLVKVTWEAAVLHSTLNTATL
jgi:hypothetical protein